jgi:hypothetical protein
MKLTRALSLVCIVAFALLAASTPAQDQTAAPLRLPMHVRTANDAANNSANAGTNAAEDPLQVKRTGEPLATEACKYTFTTGSGATLMTYCITVNGNFGGFESPAGVEMLHQGGAFEGYGVCDFSSNTEYFDYAYTDSANWNAPILVTENSTEVKIERTTSDGLWTLTQVITKVTGMPPNAKIMMTLKNNSSVTKLVGLLRFAAFVPDHASASGNFNENYDGTGNSVWGYIPDFATFSTTSDPNGLMLQNVGGAQPPSISSPHSAFANKGEGGPHPCDSNANIGGTIINAEGSGVLFYAFELTKEQSVTVTSRYIPF